MSCIYKLNGVRLAALVGILAWSTSTLAQSAHANVWARAYDLSWNYPSLVTSDNEADHITYVNKGPSIHSGYLDGPGDPVPGDSLLYAGADAFATGTSEFTGEVISAQNFTVTNSSADGVGLTAVLTYYVALSAGLSVDDSSHQNAAGHVFFEVYDSFSKKTTVHKGVDVIFPGAPIGFGVYTGTVSYFLESGQSVDVRFSEDAYASAQSALAVPEPQTQALMLMGMGAVMVAVRRRRV